MLARFEGAIEADLQEYYQVRLSDMWTRVETVRRISSLVMWLPRGARIWQMTGGQKAITEEVEALWSVEATALGIAWVQGGKKGRQPTGREFPAGYIEEERKQNYVADNAAKWRAKYAHRLKPALG